MQNDTHPEPIPWELNIDNKLFHFCVDVWLGSVKNFKIGSKF